MMEYQVKFCHHSGPRLWRTRMLFSTKSKGHKSNVHISWMYRYRFYDLKVHFWWPNKRLFSYIQRWNTLYGELNHLYLCLHSKSDNCFKAGNNWFQNAQFSSLCSWKMAVKIALSYCRFWSANVLIFKTCLVLGEYLGQPIWCMAREAPFGFLESRFLKLRPFKSFFRLSSALSYASTLKNLTFYTFANIHYLDGTEFCISCQRLKILIKAKVPIL